MRSVHKGLTYVFKSASRFFGIQLSDSPSRDGGLGPNSERTLTLIVVLLDEDEDSVSDGVRILSSSFDDAPWLVSAYLDCKGCSDREDGVK
jgi:hypothetical protein